MTSPSVPPVLLAIVSAQGRDGSAEERVAGAVAAARGAARGGATLVQVREHDLADRLLLDLVRGVREAVEPHGTAVLVNDRVDVALAAGVAGVHLKADGAEVVDVRRVAAEAGRPARADLVVSRATHSADDLAAAFLDPDLDWVVHGPVGAVPGKRSIGVDELGRRLAAARRAADDAGGHGGAGTVPACGPGWIALGGVDLARLEALASLAEPGERWGVAALRAFAGSEEDACRFAAAARSRLAP